MLLFILNLITPWHDLLLLLINYLVLVVASRILLSSSILARSLFLLDVHVRHRRVEVCRSHLWLVRLWCVEVVLGCLSDANRLFLRCSCRNRVGNRIHSLRLSRICRLYSIWLRQLSRISELRPAIKLWLIIEKIAEV